MIGALLVASQVGIVCGLMYLLGVPRWNDSSVGAQGLAILYTVLWSLVIMTAAIILWAPAARVP